MFKIPITEETGSRRKETIRVQENYEFRIKRNTPSLKIAYRPMSPDNFPMSNSYEIQSVLSYDFQLRKQAGKYFFLLFDDKFFLKSSSKKYHSEFLEKKEGKVSRGESLGRKNSAC
jgi:hypothetical protein